MYPRLLRLVRPKLMYCFVVNELFNAFPAVYVMTCSVARRMCMCATVHGADPWRQEHSPSVPCQQLSEHDARPPVLLHAADAPRQRLEPNSVQPVRLRSTRLRHQLHWDSSDTGDTIWRLYLPIISAHFDALYMTHTEVFWHSGALQIWLLLLL